MTDTHVAAVAWTIWTMSEPANYVIAACLPTLRPVLTRVLPEQMFVFSKSRNTSDKPYSVRSLKLSWPRGQAAPKLTLVGREAKSQITGPWELRSRMEDSRAGIVEDGYGMEEMAGGKKEGVVIRADEV